MKKAAKEDEERAKAQVRLGAGLMGGREAMPRPSPSCSLQALSPPPPRLTRPLLPTLPALPLQKSKEKAEAWERRRQAQRQRLLEMQQDAAAEVAAAEATLARVQGTPTPAAVATHSLEESSDEEDAVPLAARLTGGKRKAAVSVEDNDSPASSKENARKRSAPRRQVGAARRGQLREPGLALACALPRDGHASYRSPGSHTPCLLAHR